MATTSVIIVKLQVLGLRLGLDFTFALDNNHNHNDELGWWVGGLLGGSEKLRIMAKLRTARAWALLGMAIRLTSAKVEVEVETELGNSCCYH